MSNLRVQACLSREVRPRRLAEKKLDHLEVSVLRGDEEAGRAVDHLAVQLCAVAQQLLHHVQVVALACHK